MHGRQWHDHETPKDFEPEVMAAADAVPEVESSGERAGMGRQRKAKLSGSQGRVRRKRMTPVGKGIKGITKKAPGTTMKGSRAGAKRTGRAGNPG